MAILKVKHTQGEFNYSIFFLTETQLVISKTLIATERYFKFQIYENQDILVYWYLRYIAFEIHSYYIDGE